MAKIAVVRDQYYKIDRIVTTEQYDVEDMRGFRKGRDKVLISAYSGDLREVLCAHKHFRKHHPISNDGMVDINAKKLFYHNAYNYVDELNKSWHARRQRRVAEAMAS